MIKFTDGWKYQLVDDWSYQLKEPFQIVMPFHHVEGWYGLTENGMIYARRGCCWNGANSCPDFDWIMEGSLGHDVLHWLIAKGCIPEYQNNMIDKEIENIILERAPRPPLFGDKSLVVMARAVRWATHLAYQPYGEEDRPVRVLARREK